MQELVIDLAKREVETYRINQDHIAFRGTPYADRSWSVDIRFLTTAQIQEIVGNNRMSVREMKRVGFDHDADAIRSDSFVKAVVSWDIKGADGAVIPCNEENKRKVASQFPNLAVRIVQIATNRDIELLDQEEEEGKP